MTGFGRGEFLSEAHRFTVEMKAVNHRYFDVNIRIPKNLSVFETAIRQVLKEYIQRGKIDVFVTAEYYQQDNVTVRYNESIAEQYMQGIRRMEEHFGIPAQMTAGSLARFPEIFTLEQNQENADDLWQGLEKAVRQACIQFAESRRVEGEHLKEDLKEKLLKMKDAVLLIEERYPQIVEEYTCRIREKVAELIGDAQIDESRLAAELVLFSDKICTDEETVRLRSHIDTMLQVLEDGGSIGRKLDFIAQEMNREANTILSKANDLETSNIAIDLKTEIEKVREQIQNIE